MRTSPPSARAARGQALVVFSLCMLLLVVMVMMTLSIGSRVREKLELQNLAETAAYNDSVRIARTFNAVSMLNRTQISHMVALAGVQSLISWSGMYRGALHGTKAGLEEAKAPHTDECTDDGMSCGCASKMEIEGLEKIIGNEERRVAMIWEQLDAEAGNQAHEIREEALRIYDDEISVYRGQLVLALKNQSSTQNLVAAANADQPNPNELSAPVNTSSVGEREIAVTDTCSGGVGCAPYKVDAHAVWAAMGTRGYQFVTARADLSLVNKIMSLMPPGVAVTGQVGGSAFFSTEDSHGEASRYDQQAWAHDHAALKVVYARGFGKCKKVTVGHQGIDAYVKSAKHVGDEQHVWAGGSDNDPVPKHTVGGGMWPSFIDYNTALLTDASDNYGQPKTYSVLQRNYAARSLPMPWQRRFGMLFSAQGGAVDMRTTADNYLSTALGTGVAYYHRGAHWREPPNFLNPFWRATLMGADVDAQSDRDVPTTLNAANATVAARAYTLLRAVGYRGF